MPRALLRKLPIVGLGLLLGVGVGWLMKRGGADGWPVGPFLLWAMLAAPLSVLAHELGHVAAGWLVGFRPVFVMVGPLRWRKLPGGWKFDSGRLGFVGGAAACVPNTSDNLRSRLLWYISGGVLGNIAVWAVSLAFDGLFATALGWVSLLFGAIALWPKTAAVVHTDGFRIRQLLQGGPSAARWEKCVLLTSFDFRGIRPRDWPAEQVLQAGEFEDDDPDDAGAALLAYHWALDRYDLEAASTYLARALYRQDRIPVFAQGVYQIEAAFLAALYDRDAQSAYEHLEHVTERGLFRQAALFRARAMASLAGGNADEARHLAADGIAASSDDWDPGMLTADLEWLRRIASGWELPAYKTHTMRGLDS